MIIGVACALLSPTVQADQTIRAGSFMINEFGLDAEAEYERSLLGLANIVREMKVDALALQGVRDTEAGRAQVQRLVEVLNRAAKVEDDAPYQATLGASGEQEVAAFLWRSPVELVSAPQPMLVDPSSDERGRRLFRLMPQHARFRALDFEFDLLSIHLIIYPYPTDKHRGRAEEFEALVEWVSGRESAGEVPVVMAGVTNRMLKSNVWDRLQGPHTGELLRFPLMEAITGEVPDFDPVEDHAPGVSFNTVTNQNRRRIWDTVAVSRGAFDRVASEPVWGEDAGLVAFDQQLQYRWVTGAHENTIRLLSDHRPVWVEFAIDDPQQ